MTGPKELNTESQERKRQSEIADEEYQTMKRSRAGTTHKSDRELIENIARDIVKVFVCYEALEGKFDIAVADNQQLAEALEKAKRTLSSLGAAVDKAETGVKKATAEADQKRKKLMELKKENKSLLEQLDTLEKKKGGRRDEIL